MADPESNGKVPEVEGLIYKPTKTGGKKEPVVCPGEIREEDITVTCGAGNCQPSCLQPCANIKAYAANTSLMLLLTIAVFTYSVGVGRTMERRFGLNSTEVSLPGSICDFIATCVGLAIGYLGHKLHKPRVLAIGNLLVATAILLFVLPYLIYGPMDVGQFGPAESGLNQSVSDFSHGLCQVAHNSSNLVTAVGGPGCDTTRQPAGSVTAGMAKFGAFACLVSGSLLIGFGSPAVGTLALPYLDENCNNQDSAFYVGIITSMYAWSPILGFMLAAVCTSIPENLGQSSLGRSDPRFIGAWWLGFMLYGVLLVLISFPMAMFPKHLKYFYIDNKIMPTKKTKGEKSSSLSLGKEVKDFPKECWKMLCNIPFLMLVLSKVCGLYVVTGIFLQMPRYIEIHFGQPAYKANIVAGTATAIAGAIGNIIGGYLMKRLNLGTIGSARMLVYSLIVGTVSLLISMLLACPQPPIVGHLNPSSHMLDIKETCNADCACPLTLRPVCVNHTSTYVSPCHAGCKVFSNNTFSECGCAGEAPVPVSEGYCTSIECNMLLPYIIVGTISSFLGSIGRVPATMLMFRIVEKKDKAFAIGILSFALNLLCFVPSPIMFGRLIDSGCRLWEERCGTRGACLIYDIAKFRYFMHGVTLVFKVASLVFAIIVLILVTRNEKRKREEAEIDQDSNGQGEKVEIDSVKT